MKVALYGGTFDPFHLGHWHLAKAAQKELCLDKVIFIPAFLPPHKSTKDITSPHHRLAMLRLGLLGEPRFEISSYELEKRSVCYTIDTVKALYRRHPEWKRVFLLLGADSAQHFSKWKEASALSELVSVVVGARPGSTEVSENPLRLTYLHNDPFDASSEKIRTELKRAHLDPKLLPAPVWDYIQRHELYR